MLGYRFAGVTGTVAESEAEVRAAFAAALGRAGCAVLLVTRAASRWIAAELADHRRTGRQPFVAVVSDVHSRREEGPSLESMIQGAIGIKTGET